MHLKVFIKTGTQPVLNQRVGIQHTFIDLPPRASNYFSTWYEFSSLTPKTNHKLWIDILLMS